MLFRRNEPKKGHPLCTMVVVTMTAIGTWAVISATKQKMTEMCQGMKKMFCMKKKNACYDTASADVCPVCGERKKEVCDNG